MYDPDGVSYERPIASDETASEAVVLAVAAATGLSPSANDASGSGGRGPLSDAVDTDALDAMFDGNVQDCWLTFRWEGCEIVIDGGTRVVVTPSR